MWQTYDKFNQQSNIAFQSLMSSMWKQHKKAFGAATCCMWEQHKKAFGAATSSDDCEYVN
jgi:hypothetical protein